MSGPPDNIRFVRISGQIAAVINGSPTKADGKDGKYDQRGYY